MHVVRSIITHCAPQALQPSTSTKVRNSATIAQVRNSGCNCYLFHPLASSDTSKLTTSHCMLHKRSHCINL